MKNFTETRANKMVESAPSELGPRIRSAPHQYRYVSGEVMRILLAMVISLCSAVSFASPISYVCNYESYSDEEGNHKTKEQFLLTFVVDAENGKGYIVGNQGSEEVVVIPQKTGGIAFVEVTGSGNVMTTAIDTAGTSVHSRNTSIGGKLVPTQYYGKCEVKQ